MAHRILRGTSDASLYAHLRGLLYGDMDIGTPQVAEPATTTIVTPGESTFGENHILGIAHNGLSGTSGRWVAVGQNGRMAWAGEQ